MIRFALLAAAFGLSGCLFGDCEFSGPDSYVQGSGELQADLLSAGDTLTVALVGGNLTSGSYAELDGSISSEFERNPTPSSDQVVRLAFDQESALFGDREPYQIEAVAVGDTVYVYIVGTLDPALFSQACSPSEPAGVFLQFRSVSAPASVQRIETAYLQAGDLPPAAARALRQRDAHRTITV